MSVLSGKHVLVIGDETSQVHDLEVSLEREGSVIYTSTCAETTHELIEDKQIDVMFINHLHDDSHCTELLEEIQSKRDTKVLPIFVLVNDNQKDIEHALALGAADYFTSNETAKGIMNKVRIVMGEPVNAADDTVIDIGDSTTVTKSSGTRVLIVEDDPLLANLLSIRLDKANFPYKINPDGQKIIADLDDFKPDVVILDIMLPGTSGFEVLAEIRGNKTHKDLPVFIFSNRDSDADKQKASDLVISGFFVKAMTDLTDLVKSIEKVTADNRQSN